MDRPHHMAAVMELDLTACHQISLVDRINAMPALKTSAAFFTFLRANLVLHEMASHLSTPMLEPIIVPARTKGKKKGGAAAKAKATLASSTASSAPASTTAAATDGASVSLDDIPPLSLAVLSARPDEVDALRLVADSVAQQGQAASRSLVFHPLNLSGLALALAAAYQWNPRHDLGMVLSMMSGVVMTYLLGIRYCSAPYVRLAEGINWAWLWGADAAKGGKDETRQDAADTIIGAKYGEEMIGALVLHLESAAPATQNQRDAPGRGTIRAWTTKLRYRRRGIGGDLLSEAVRVTRERCGQDAPLAFAPDHANSHLILPEMYNGVFRQTERRAERALQKALAEAKSSNGQRK